MQKNILLKYILTLLYLIFQTTILNSQTVKVKATNQPLNEVLIELREFYDFQFSFDDNLLTKIIISDSSSYKSPKAAISNLIKDTNLDFKILNDIFVIFEKPKTLEKEKFYTFNAQVLDKNNTEPLPFSTVEISQSGLIADRNGNFSIRSKDEKIKVKISHLGYAILDTILEIGSENLLELTPAEFELDEVVIESEAKIYDSHIGEKSGLIKLNHKITSFLPGNNDNTIFNLLRLQPGVLASNEQTNDYIIWGSYKGQTLIQFDGIPLFNISSLDDKIGVVNPLILKDIEILKGGYSANFGNRVGGVVNITGNSGNSKKLTTQINANNQTLSGTLNIPILKKYSLQTSFRKTYDFFFENCESNSSRIRRDKFDTFSPENRFQDLNVKFSGKNEFSDNFYFSFLGNKNDSYYNFNIEEKDFKYSTTNEKERTQLGGAFFYSKNWQKFGRTNSTISYSELSSNSFSSINFRKIDSFEKSDFYTENGISELSIKSEHLFPTQNQHSLSGGIEFVKNFSKFSQSSSKIDKKIDKNEVQRFGFYLKDNLSISKKISLEPSLRIDFPINISNLYFQPRINATFKPFGNWKFNFAWGIYNQFITEIALIDEFENPYYLWQIADEEIYSVQSGRHYNAGLSFFKKEFTFSVEGFFKNTEGLNKLILDRERNLTFVTGKSRNFGIDFYVKQEIKRHNFWISYTLSKAEENFGKDYFQKAPQDQRHEVKIAGLLNFNPFFISSNFIYGSGFNNSSLAKDFDNNSYKRLDLAFLYKFRIRTSKLETGISILNTLNEENIKFDNFSNFPESKTFFSKGVPYTLSIFLNVKF